MILIVALFSAPVLADTGDKELNVLFIGADNDRLLMTALYNIDGIYQTDAIKSRAIFFPSETLIALNPQKTLSHIFKEQDASGLIKYLENKLDVQISYYIRIERRALEEAQSFIEPIEVAGETVPLTDLFTMTIGPYDEVILGRLMERFTRPSVYFYHLPKLVLSDKNLVQTDFSPTIQNLWLHFQIATKVETASIKKTVLQGRPLLGRAGGLYIPPDTWRSVLTNKT